MGPFIIRWDPLSDLVLSGTVVGFLPSWEVVPTFGILANTRAAEHKRLPILTLGAPPLPSRAAC